MVLAAVPAYPRAAAYRHAPPPRLPSATIRIAPGWTYRGGGKLAVITRCSHRRDLRAVSSRMLRHPASLPRRGDLLIRVTRKTRPGRYTIAVWCVTARGQVDAMDVRWVRIRKRLKGWKRRPPPPLPRHFRPRVTVSTWAPARHRKHRR